MNWDDDVYVYANPAFHPLSADGIARMVSGFYYYAYIPVTLLSHAADVAVWGMNPHGHHLTNVLLHTWNAVWVFLLGIALCDARRKTRAGVAAALGMGLAALFFAIHPLRSESVSWISDRKDLLCAWFLLPSCLAYVRCATEKDAGRARLWYLASFALFALACLSKLIAAMFPVILLLLDRLWLERPRTDAGGSGAKGSLRRLFLEKAPFFLVSLALIALTRTVSPHAKKAYAVSHLSRLETFLFPFFSLLFSIYKTLLPTHLAPIYPRFGLAWMAGGLVLFLAITALLWGISRRGSQGPLLAWLVYLALLLPNVIGLSSGMQPVADRYSYLATAGLYLLLGSGIAWTWERIRPRSRWAVVAGAAALAVALGSSTHAQAARWKSSVALWESVVHRAAEKPDYTDAYLNLGVAYSEAGRVSEARNILERAAALDPKNADALYDLGVLTYQAGDRQGALARFRAACQVDPRHAKAWYNCAIVLDQLGRHDEAVLAMVRSARLGWKDAQDALAGLGIGW